MFIRAVIPVFMDDNNLNKTTTKESDVVEMTCQSEAKPPPRMYFQRWGSDQPYTSGYQEVSVTSARLYTVLDLKMTSDYNDGVIIAACTALHAYFWIEAKRPPPILYPVIPCYA